MNPQGLGDWGVIALALRLPYSVMPMSNPQFLYGHEIPATLAAGRAGLAILVDGVLHPLRSRRAAGPALASISRARWSDRVTRRGSRPGIGLADPSRNSDAVRDLSGCVLASHSALAGGRTIGASRKLSNIRLAEKREGSSSSRRARGGKERLWPLGNPGKRRDLQSCDESVRSGPER